MRLLDNLGSLRMKCRRAPRSPRMSHTSPVSSPESVRPPYVPKAPLFTKYKGALFVLASSDTDQRRIFSKTLKQFERMIIERLNKMVYYEMEMRVYLTERAVAVGKSPDEAELTYLQKKAAECALSRQNSVTLPPPFSSIPRKVSDPSALPATVSAPSISYEEEDDSTEDWETVNNLGSYFEFFRHSLPPATPKRLTRIPARALGSIRIRGKNVPIKKADDGPGLVNEDYREIVHDFIAQESAYFAGRNKPVIASSSSAKESSARIPRKSIPIHQASTSVTSSRCGNDDSLDASMMEPANRTLVSNAFNDNAPLIQISWNSTTIGNEIFDRKDGALQTKDVVPDFRNSVSASGRLTRSETVDFQSEGLEESKTLGALSSLRPAPPTLIDNDETPKKVITSFVRGMKRIDTMNSFHAMRGGSSVSDLYSNADDVASPVPFSTNIAAGDNARDRHLGLVPEDEDNWTSSPRDSLMELNDQAIVAKRLAEEASKAEEEKLRPLEKERRKQQKKAKLQSKIEATEQLLKHYEEKYHKQRQSLEDIDKEDYSPSKDEDSSPLPMGKCGSQVFLRRHQLTQFSESSLFSDDMRTPKQSHAENTSNASFSSPQRKLSPFAQPPMNAMGSMSMSDMSRSESAKTTSSGETLHGFPLPASDRDKLQKRQHTLSIPNMAHASSDAIVPSSPTNKFGSVDIRGKWKGEGSVRSRVENFFSDDIVPCVEKRLSRVPKPLGQNSPIMAMFQGLPNTPSCALPKAAPPPNEFATHIPAISSGGYVTPPARVSIRANAYGVRSETSSQRLAPEEPTAAKSAVEMNNSMAGDRASVSVDEDGDKFYSAHSSPHFLHDEDFSIILPSQTSEMLRSALGLVSSMEKNFELHGALSLPVFSSETPHAHISPIPGTTPHGTPTRRTLLSVPDLAALSSSPLGRSSAPASPEMAVQRGIRPFLPASRTIPQSLVAQSTITRTDDRPITRSPERGPYMDRSVPSMYRLNSTLKLPEAGDEDPDSFLRNVRKAVEWAEKSGKRLSEDLSELLE